MYEDFSERLFTHYIGGAWRVPYGTRALPVILQDGQKAGHVIAAEAADIVRLRKQVQGADATSVARFATLIAQATDDLAQALSLQGGHGWQGSISELADSALAQADDTGHPACLVTSVRQNPRQFGRTLGKAIANGVVYCPPPQDALFATRLACIAQRADLPAGAFNLLYGDRQTHALMAQAGIPCV